MTDIADNLEKDWKKYTQLCGKFEDDNLNKMLDELGERIILCPASNRKSGGFCSPGGLVSHSLDTASKALKMSSSIELSISKSSILKVCLLHDLGKIGDLENDLMIEETSDWHIEKLGQIYKYNENIQKMTTSHRTLFLLQHYGVSLDNDEWIAIATSQGSHLDENKFYEFSNNPLSTLIQSAKKMSITMHLNN